MVTTTETTVEVTKLTLVSGPWEYSTTLRMDIARSLLQIRDNFKLVPRITIHIPQKIVKRIVLSQEIVSYCRMRRSELFNIRVGDWDYKFPYDLYGCNVAFEADEHNEVFLSDAEFRIVTLTGVLDESRYHE